MGVGLVVLHSALGMHSAAAAAVAAASGELWDVSEQCVEHMSAEPQIRAVGVYAVDTCTLQHPAGGIGGDGEAAVNIEQCVRRGSFGVVLNVRDPVRAAVDPVQRGEYALRICTDAASFAKQCELLFAVQAIAVARQSPFFLQMRTAFTCTSHIDKTVRFATSTAASSPQSSHGSSAAAVVPWSRVFSFLRQTFNIAETQPVVSAGAAASLREMHNRDAAVSRIKTAPAPLLTVSEHASAFARCLPAYAMCDGGDGTDDGSDDGSGATAADDDEGGKSAGGTPLYCLVMERANASTLAELIQEWSHDAGAAATRQQRRHIATVFMFQLAQALAAMHRMGIAHRDVKSSNVVLDCRQTEPGGSNGGADDRRFGGSPVPTSTGGGGGTAAPGGRQTFGFFDPSFGMRIYRPPSVHHVPGMRVQQRCASDGANASVCVKFIDFDFSMMARGGQVKHYTWGTEGSPTNMAPELVYLACAGINCTQHVFKPDVYSLGVLYGELATERPMAALLQQYGFRKRDMHPHNVIYVAAAYAGFPRRAALRAYRAFIKQYLEHAPKTVSTRRQRNTAMQSLLALRDLFDTRTLIDAVRAVHRFATASATAAPPPPDCVRQLWGVSMQTLHEGALFCELRARGEDGSALARTLAGMLQWDFERRHDAYDALFSPMFDEYRAQGAAAHDDVWLLSVPHTGRRAPAPATDSAPRGLCTLEAKVAHGECVLPGCATPAVPTECASRQYAAAAAYCSSRCKRVGEQHSWWRTVAAPVEAAVCTCGAR